LTEFVNVYGLKTAPNPRTELGYFSDYDRFDLNGKWFFLKDTDHFDLDPENSTYLGAARYGIVHLKIGTTDIPLDENKLTKTQILCYYAYSPLYLGDDVSRSNLLPVSVCSGKPNNGISSVATSSIGAGAEARVDCTLSNATAVCRPQVSRSGTSNTDSSSLEVSYGAVENVGGSTLQPNTASASNTFVSSVQVGPSNGNLLTVIYNSTQILSAKTLYPDDPTQSTFTSNALADTSAHQEVYFTLDRPATYIATVNLLMPSRPLGSKSQAGGSFSFYNQSTNTSLVLHRSGTGGDQTGSQIYTGVLSPGSYATTSHCQAIIDLSSVNKTTPAGESDSMTVNCEATLDIVPNN